MIIWYLDPSGNSIGHDLRPPSASDLREALLQSLDLKIVAPALLDGDEGGGPEGISGVA